jgi:hypothetical protein
MKTHHLRVATGLILLGLLSLLAGCGSVPTRAPVFVAAGFEPRVVDPIAILTVADLRKDKSVDINVNDIAQKAAKNALTGRKYRVELVPSGPDYTRLSDEDLSHPPAAWIKSLPPSGKRWVMIVGVHDITRKLTFGSTGNAEVSAYLYDKETGTAVWRDKGVGQAGQGGLIGMAMIGMMSQQALEAAVATVFVGLPPRPEKP